MEKQRYKGILYIICSGILLCPDEHVRPGSRRPAVYTEKLFS